MSIPIKTIERMSLYRRVINRLVEAKKDTIFSYELGKLINKSAAQVRRDFMEIGQKGNPQNGYNILELRHALNELMIEPEGQKIALVGIGNLGRAILTYFMGRSPNLAILAAFDSEKKKTNRVIAGCKCYDISKMKDIIKKHKITIGIMTVPLTVAQDVADQLVSAGIKSIVNWAPIHIEVPKHIFLESRDITMSIEKAAYFAKKQNTL